MAFTISNVVQDLDTDRFILRGDIALTGSSGTTGSTANGSVPKDVDLDEIAIWQVAGNTFPSIQVVQDQPNGALDFTSSAVGTNETFKFRAAFRANADQDGSSINQDNDT